MADILFGSYLVKEFGYRKQDIDYVELKCQILNSKISATDTSCMYSYFRLLLTCLYVSSEIQIEKQCGCNNECLYSNSCCFDKFFLEEPAPPEQYLETFLSKTAEHSDKVCLPLLEAENAYKIETVYMRDNCPHDFNIDLDKLRSQCLQSDKFEPPVCVPEERSIFKNEYCARCNGHPLYYRINATAARCTRQCVTKKLSGEISQANLTDCQYLIQKGQADVIHDSVCRARPKRINDASLVSTGYYCNDREYALCKSYRAEVVHDFESYANPQCVKCLKNSRKISFWYDELYTSLIEVEQYSWNITYVNNQRHDGEVQLRGGMEHCFGRLPGDSGDLARPFTLKPHANMQINEVLLRCIFENHGSLYLTSKPNNLGPRMISRLEASLKDMLGFKVNLKKPSIGNNFHARNAGKISAAEGLLIARAYSNDDLWNEVDQMVLTPLDYIQSSLMHGRKLEHMFLDGKVCMDPVVFDIEYGESINVSDDCTIHSLFSVDGVLPSYSEKGNTIFWIEMSFGVLMYRVAVCKVFHLLPKCSVRIYEPWQFIVRYNKSVEVIGSNGFSKRLSPEEYQPTTTGIAVCESELTALVSLEIQTEISSILFCFQAVVVYIILEAIPLQGMRG